MSDGRIFVAKESFVMRWEGADVIFVGGTTRIREGHPIMKGREHLFREIDVHYDVEQATAAPGERRGG